MKKFLVLCGGIALVSAGAAFALDLPDALQIPGLTVSGDVRTGLRVDGGTFDDFGKNNIFQLRDEEAGAVDPTVYAYSDDIDDGTPFRAQLVLQWQRDNLGVKTRLRYVPIDGATLGSSTLATLNNTVNQAFVWGSILDGKAKITLGKTLDAAYGLFYSNYSGYNNVTRNSSSFDGKDGGRLDVTPIDGLTVGAFYGSGNLFTQAFKTYAPTSYDETTDRDRRFVIGAKYVTGPISFVASLYHNFYDWEQDDGDNYGNYYTDTSETSKPKPYFNGDALDNFDWALPNTSNLLVGFRYAEGGLQADLSLAFVNLGSMTYRESINHLSTDDLPNVYKKGNYNPFWAFSPKLKVAYSLDEKITVALGLSDLKFADMYYYDERKEDDAENSGLGHLFPITINPSVAYAIDDNITASVDLNFKINSNGSDQFGFGVKPAAEFSLGSGATFVVYDEITFWAKSNDDDDFIKKHSSVIPGGVGPNALNGGNNGASGTTNTLQFDFVWTF